MEALKMEEVITLVQAVIMVGPEGVEAVLPAIQRQELGHPKLMETEINPVVMEEETGLRAV